MALQLNYVIEDLVFFFLFSPLACDFILSCLLPDSHKMMLACPQIISIFKARKHNKEEALAVSLPFLKKANIFPEACLANLCLCVTVQNCMACGLPEGKKGLKKKKSVFSIPVIKGR